MKGKHLSTHIKDKFPSDDFFSILDEDVIVEEQIVPTEAHFEGTGPNHGGVVASAPSVRDWNREQVAQWLEASGLAR